MIKEKEEFALREITKLLNETGKLNEGENITILENDQHIYDEKISLKIDNGSVVGLSLRFCGLRYLPESLGSLVNLRHLFIHDNNLVALPLSIGCLQKLKVLDAANNQLENIPTSIGQLKSLKFLYLHNNKLKHLPESIKGLCKLIFK